MRYRTRRRVIGPRLRKYIPCGYCFEEWADCYDHITPVAHGGTNRKSNLYPACNRCNGLLHDLVFDSLDEKRNYIRAKLKERQEWHSGEEMQRMRESLPAQTGMAEILLRPMPMDKMGTRQPANKKEPNARCPVCGERFYGQKWFCSKACLTVLWFNLLLERYLKS